MLVCSIPSITLPTRTVFKTSVRKLINSKPAEREKGDIENTNFFFDIIHR